MLCLFCSEVANIDLPLTIELWSKGVLWDSLLGSTSVPLNTVIHTNEASFLLSNDKNISKIDVIYDWGSRKKK